MPNLTVNDDITIPDAELRFTYSRSPGPGGQNVNKLNTKATLHWDVTTTENLPESVRARFLALYSTRINNQGQLVMTSTRYRVASRNMEDCLDKLREMILAATKKPKRRIPTRRSASSKRKRLKNKKQHSEKKQSRRSTNWD